MKGRAFCQDMVTDPYSPSIAPDPYSPYSPLM
jgi:hypothetical protein